MKNILYVNNIANTGQSMMAALGVENNVVFKQFPLRKPGESSLVLILKQIAYSIYLACLLRQFDVSYVNYGYFAAFSLLSRKPLYLHCHGTDVRFNRLTFFNLMTRICIWKAKKVFVSTPDLIKSIPEKHRGKCTFIPNTIDKKHFKIDNLVTPPKREKLKILVISKLDKTKGIEEIFKALPEIGKMDDICLISYFGFGNLPQLPSVQKNDKFRSIPKLNYNEMPKLITDHDIVIGQIKLGAIGMSELEAMWMKRPVLAKFDYDDAYLERCPVIRVKGAQDIIYEVARITQNKEIIHTIGEKSHYWVAKYHTDQALIQKYKEVFL